MSIFNDRAQDEIQDEIEAGEKLALSGLGDYVDYYGMPHAAYYLWRDFAPISLHRAAAMGFVAFILFRGSALLFYDIGMAHPFGHIAAAAILVAARRLF